MTEEGGWVKDLDGGHRVISSGELRKIHGNGRERKLQPKPMVQKLGQGIGVPAQRLGFGC